MVRNCGGKTPPRAVSASSSTIPVPQARGTIFAQGQLRTVESALGCEYATAQQNLQQHYLTQVQGVHQELQTAKKSFNELLSKEKAERHSETDMLRRELAETATHQRASK